MPTNVTAFSIGVLSRQNEDAYKYIFSTNEVLIAAIADGVGGNAGGGIASTVAVDLVIEVLAESPDKEFHSIFEQISAKLTDISEDKPDIADMATTLTVCVVGSGVVRFAHVGDSRLYHLRANGIVQKTQDQTEVALLVEQGVLTPRKAKKYPRRSILLSALSARGDYDLTQGTFELQKGDRLMLVTDGAYKELSKRELRDESIAANNIEKLGAKLQDILASSEPSDDATMVLIDYY